MTYNWTVLYVKSGTIDPEATAMPLRRQETHRTTIRLPIRVRENLKAVARATGRSESSIVIAAIEQETQRLLGPSMYDRLRDLIDTVEPGNGSAVRMSDPFGDILAEKRENGTL
jgi:hypothetical protein